MILFVYLSGIRGDNSMKIDYKTIKSTIAGEILKRTVKNEEFRNQNPNGIGTKKYRINEEMLMLKIRI